MPGNQEMTTLICGGYTAAGYLGFGLHSDPDKISLTSYSGTFRTNVIQSQAMLKYATDVNTIERTKGAFILGVPTITCDIGFEIEYGMLKDIIDTLIEERNKVCKVIIQDYSSRIEWNFDECYIQSFSFSVQADSILSVNLSFFVQPNTLSYSFEDRTTEAKSRGLDGAIDTDIPIRQPIPYYAWDLDGIDDVLEFSFSFSQQITPKFECSGDMIAEKAPIAQKLVFGLPTMEFEYTQLLNKSGEINIDSDNETYHSKEEDLEEDCLKIKVRDNDLFTLTGLKLIEETPNLTGTPSIRRAYLVNGTIKK